MNELNKFNLELFDKHSNVKANFLFWVVCLCLARAWIIFIIAGVSQTQGTVLLSLFYPSHDGLYFGLGCGFFAVILMLLAGNLHHFPLFFARFWRYGKEILLINIIIDLGLQIQALYLMQWRFDWSSALILLVTAWLGVYLVMSKRIQFLFKTPINRVKDGEGME